MKVFTNIFIILYLHSYFSKSLALVVATTEMGQIDHYQELEACYFIHSKTKSIIFVPVSKRHTPKTKLRPDSIYFLKRSCKGGVKSMKKCSKESKVKFLPASDNSKTFPPDSIYFLETSCKGGLDTRQACCVESAARSNPRRQVNLIFTLSVTKLFVKSTILNSLLQYKNVRISKIYADQYVKGTPLESLFARKYIRKSKYPIEHNSDVLRVVTLYKYGGTYLDTDVIVTKSFDTLPKNWIPKESKSTSNGILSFSKDEAGRNFTTAVLKLMNATYQPDERNSNGPRLLAKVLSQMCRTGNVETNEIICPGFTVFGPKKFYPIPWPEWIKYFEPDSGNRVLDEPYTYHFWNKYSKYTKITNNSLMDKLAKTYCPRVYELSQGLLLSKCNF